MLDKMLEYLNLNFSKPEVISLDESHHDRTVLITRPGTQNPVEYKTFRKEVSTREHGFDTIDGFVDYLKSRHCADDRGVIFVSDENITAHLKYLIPGHHTAMVALEASEEYAALETLTQGVTQKTLWEMMNSKLFDCFPLDFLLMISNLEVSTDGKQQIKIDATGLASTRGSTDQVIMEIIDDKGGVKQEKVRTEWTFEGRIWACFDMKHRIECKLEFKVANGMVFVIFHLRRLDSVLRQARLDLVQRLKGEDLGERFTVHEGSYCAT